MSDFDLQFLIPFFINLLKSQSQDLPWDWDAFSLLNPNLISWINISFHVFLLLLFSFTSPTFIFPTRRPSPNRALIRFRFGNFSPHMAVSLVCSLVLPQALFWFIYPAILIFSCLLGWVNLKLSALPVWYFQVTFTLSRQPEPNIQGTDLQVPVPQVSLDISPDAASNANADANANA